MAVFGAAYTQVSPSPMLGARGLGASPLLPAFAPCAGGSKSARHRGHSWEPPLRCHSPAPPRNAAASAWYIEPVATVSAPATEQIVFPHTSANSQLRSPAPKISARRPGGSRGGLETGVADHREVPVEVLRGQSANTPGHSCVASAGHGSFVPPPTGTAAMGTPVLVSVLPGGSAASAASVPTAAALGSGPVGTGRTTLPPANGQVRAASPATPPPLSRNGAAGSVPSFPAGVAMPAFSMSSTSPSRFGTSTPQLGTPQPPPPPLAVPGPVMVPMVMPATGWTSTSRPGTSRTNEISNSTRYVQLEQEVKEIREQTQQLQQLQKNQQRELQRLGVGTTSESKLQGVPLLEYGAPSPPTHKKECPLHEQRATQLEKELAQKTQEHRRVAEDLEKLSQQLEEKTQKNENLEQQIAQYERLEAQTASQAQRDSEFAVRSHEAARRLEGEKRQLEVELERRREDTCTLQRQVEQLQAALGQQQEALSKQQAAMEQADVATRQEREKVLTMQNDLRDYKARAEAELRDYKARAEAELRDHKARVEAELRDYKNRAEAAEQQVNHIQEQGQVKEQQELRRLRTENQAFRDKHQKQQQIIIELKQDLREAETYNTRYNVSEEESSKYAREAATKYYACSKMLAVQNKLAEREIELEDAIKKIGEYERQIAPRRGGA